MTILKIEDVYNAVNRSDKITTSEYIKSVCGVELNPGISARVSYETYSKWNSAVSKYNGLKFSFTDRTNYKSVWRMVKVGKGNTIDISKIAKTVKLMNQLYSEYQDRLEKQSQLARQQSDTLAQNRDEWQKLGYQESGETFLGLGSNENTRIQTKIGNDGIYIHVDRLTPQEAHEIMQMLLEKLN